MRRCSQGGYETIAGGLKNWRLMADSREDWWEKFGEGKAQFGL